VSATEGLDIEQSDDGFKWTYQSQGGAFFVAPKTYKTRAAARKAGRAWVTETYPEGD
jgi:hypothetical protein